MDQVQQPGKSVFLFYKVHTASPPLSQHCPYSVLDQDRTGLVLGRKYLLVPSRHSRDPRDPPTLTPPQGQGGCSGEMGRNVGEWRTENQEAPLPLWHYGARKQGGL